MRFETILRIIFTRFQLDKAIDQIASHEKLKNYDKFESLFTRYFVPTKNLTDFLEGKIDSKKQIIQIMNILLWIAPIKWLIEFIVFQHYDYHEAAYYT